MEEMETYIDMDIIGNKLDYIINLDSGFSEEYLYAFLSLNVVHDRLEDIKMRYCHCRQIVLWCIQNRALETSTSLAPKCL